MNILEDLWFGNISPWERPFKKDSAYAELLSLVIRHQEDLLVHVWTSSMLDSSCSEEVLPL